MFKNILWDLIGKFGSQLATFVVSIVLARIISPQEYGIVAMAMVVIGFAQVFLDAGFNRALIQQTEVSQIQYSTIFFINLALAALLFCICFALANPLAVFFKQAVVAPVLRVAAVGFLINGINLVPSALMYKGMHFKVNSLNTLIAGVISGTTAILMAYHGYGLWALVAQSLIAASLLLLLNLWFIRWMPSLVFSFAAIKSLWHYGSRMFASGVLDTICTRLDIFLVGRLFTAELLGYYGRAQSLDAMVRQFSATGIMGALFPYIARHQHDREYVATIFQRYLHIILFVSVGMAGALFLLSEQLFTWLFSERWLYAAHLFKYMAVLAFVFPVSALMCNIIAALGNAKAFLRLEVYKKLIFLPAYVFGFAWGIEGFLICMMVSYGLSLLVNIRFTKYEIAVTMSRQVKVIGAYLFVGAASTVLCLFAATMYTPPHPLLFLIFYGLMFASLYILLSRIFELRGAQVLTYGFNRIKLALQ